MPEHSAASDVEMVLPFHRAWASGKSAGSGQGSWPNRTPFRLAAAMPSACRFRIFFRSFSAIEQIGIDIVFNFNADAPLTLRNQRGCSLGSGAGSRFRDSRSHPAFSLWTCSKGDLKNRIGRKYVILVLSAAGFPCSGDQSRSMFMMQSAGLQPFEPGLMLRR